MPSDLQAEEVTMGIERITAREFREFGYLQEVNRNFLHPLGLALEIVIDGDEIEFGGVWDYRDDPEGMRYGAGQMDPVKADRVAEEWESHAVFRKENLGYIVQPIGDQPEEEPVI